MNQLPDTLQTPTNVVFLGGIPLSSKRETLLAYIGQFGQVTNLALPRYKPSGTLKGYAKASFRTVQQAEAFVASQPHMIGGLDVGVSYWQDKDSYLANKDQQNERKVFVRFNPNALTADDLEAYFTQYGAIHSISIKSDIDTMRTKDYCYILFEEIVSAQMAVQESPHYIRGFQTHCEMSQPAHITRQLRNQARRTIVFQDSAAHAQHDHGSDYQVSESEIRYLPKRQKATSVAFMNQGSFQSNQFPSVLSVHPNQGLQLIAEEQEIPSPDYEYGARNHPSSSYPFENATYNSRFIKPVWDEEPAGPVPSRNQHVPPVPNTVHDKYFERNMSKEQDSPSRNISTMSTYEQMFDFGRQLSSQKSLKNKLSLELNEQEVKSCRHAIDFNCDSDSLCRRGFFSSKKSQLSNSLGKAYALKVATNHTSENLQFKIRSSTRVQGTQQLPNQARWVF